MCKEAIYVYGKTMESISERHDLCKQVVSNEDTLIYVDIRVVNGYRPAMQKLIEDIDANLVSTIYVANIQTISRDIKEYAQFKNYIDSKGVNLISVNALINPLKDLLPTMTKAIDEWESIL